MCSLVSVRSCVCCALPLGFGGQRLPCPAGICFRFRLAYIDWPIQRQGDFVEHRAIQPLIGIVLALPECRMRNSPRGYPLPVFIVVVAIVIVAVAPERAGFVAAPPRQRRSE